MLTLCLTRHAESACQGRLCGGGCDAALTATGQAQAQALGRRYGAVPADAIYCSPQTRALDTAGPLASLLGIGISPDPRLREITYGRWDGLTRDQIPPEALAAFGRSEAPAPEGESLVEVAQRMAEVFAEVRARHPHGRVWLLSHHTSLRLLLCQVLGMELGRYRTLPLAPGAISLLGCEEDRVTLVHHGLVDHLDAPGR